MKILWIVNTIFPYPSKKIGLKETNFGGWLNGLADELIKNSEIKIAIATVYNGKKILEFNDGEVIYYLIPGAPSLKYNKKLEEYWKQINNIFSPDLVHIHGTEFAHGLAFKNACENVKVVTSIQGLVSVISDVYYANIGFCDILKNITLRDIIKNDSIFSQKRKFEERGKNEIQLIIKSDVIIGRTSWDYANCKAIKPDMKYFPLNETLRKTFYNNSWDIKNIDRHSIFCSQAGYPIKGLHYMLRALYLLKKKYSDVKLFIAGPNIFDVSTFTKKLRLTGYAKYIFKLIKKYNLKDQVIYIGVLNEKEMVDKLLKTNVFCCNSIIENESNSLSEAAIMGVPSVASYVGGIPDRIDHGKNAFMYPYTEYSMLAELISNLFDNDELCIEFGLNSKKNAKARHYRSENARRLIDIYYEVIKI